MAKTTIRYVRDQVAAMGAGPKNALAAYGYRAQGAISVGREMVPEGAQMWDALDELVAVAWRERMLRGNEASGQAGRKRELEEARWRAYEAVRLGGFVD